MPTTPHKRVKIITGIAEAPIVTDFRSVLFEEINKLWNVTRSGCRVYAVQAKVT